MVSFILRRILWALPTIFLITIVTFVIIQLPPGDFVTSYVAQLKETGEDVTPAEEDALRDRFGLNDPFYVQYYRWISGIVLEGDFGQSFDWNLPVSELIWQRIGLTVVISLTSLLFTWIIAIPIGVFSATNQYSWFDYIFTVVGFIGRGIPNFLLALILMWLSFAYLGFNVGGLFSEDYVNAPWSIAKILDLIAHLWVPVLVLGTGGAAGLIRIMRANMLDEIYKPYVETAYAQGLTSQRVIWKYPVRVALNPFISTVGWALPGLISGSIITSVVLNLPTTGPLLLRALLNQDMFLAGSFILVLSAFTVVGTLLSDILLAWSDPRVRLS